MPGSLPDKKRVLAQIVESLQAELASLTEAARAAREAATHEESKPEDQYDTRGLEASYLAGAQAERALQVQRMITYFRELAAESSAAGGVIAPGALVELESGGKKLRYLLAAMGGGISVSVDGLTLSVITPQAPLGETLAGARAGDEIEVETQGAVREYRILAAD